jgi:hypothetical protein
VLQRNPGPDPVDIPAIPATVAGGEVVDWHLPIAGFEPVEPDPIPAKPAITKPTPVSTPAVPDQPHARSTAAGQE